MQTVEPPPAGRGATPPKERTPTAPIAEAPAASSTEAPPDLQLLLNWARDPDESSRLRKAAIGTAVVHLLLILSLAMMSAPTVKPVHVPERPRLVTHLTDPPTELTQRTPNKGAITKELAVQSILPSVPVPSPAPGAKARKFEPPPAPPPTKPAVVAQPAPEPPKIEQAQNTTPQILTQLPPQIQPQAPRPSDTKPKLTFETPPPAPTGPVGQPRIPPPQNTVQEAVRELSHGGSNGMSGSDSMDLGRGSGLNLPPSAGRPQLDWQMKFDPQGVDFKPYILQVLAAVRRNWFAVYPESAKLGTRGQVKLDFAIAKDGTVTKVAYSWQSGSNALDHAAVAAISASNPLPPLPADFRGNRIVLSFTFSYNMGR